MSSAAAPIPPVAANFEAKVSITLDRGFLATCGPLFCDPVVRAYVVQNTVSGAKHPGGIPISRTLVGQSSRKVFTAHPAWHEKYDAAAQQAAVAANNNTNSTATVPTPPDIEFALKPADHVLDLCELELEVRDCSSDAFLGLAHVPLSLTRTSVFDADGATLMLHPRTTKRIRHNAVTGRYDAEVAIDEEDTATLEKYKMDDFGFLKLHRAALQLQHLGGIYVPTAEQQQQQQTASPAPSFPIGCSVKAQWLSAAALGGPGSVFCTQLQFDRADPFITVDGDRPIHVSIPEASKCTLFFNLSVIEGGSSAAALLGGAASSPPVAPPTSTSPAGKTVATATLALPSLDCISNFNRDIYWMCPVTPAAPQTRRPTSSSSSSHQQHHVFGAAPNGQPQDLGVLMVQLRLQPKPVSGFGQTCPRQEQQQQQQQQQQGVGFCPDVNDPQHQLEASHRTVDFGRPAPDCPPGPYQAIVWESEQHIGRATERRWQRSCVVESKPSQEHVRHIHDAMLGRVMLDPSIMSLLQAFRSRPQDAIPQMQQQGGVDPAELRQLLVALVFGLHGLAMAEALRTCFFILRDKYEEAIGVDTVVYILENSLLPRTLDMPASEIRRRVHDIFSPQLSYVTYDMFTEFFVKNVNFWYTLGVPVEAPKSSQRQQGSVAPHKHSNKNSKDNKEGAAAGLEGASSKRSARTSAGPGGASKSTTVLLRSSTTATAATTPADLATAAASKTTASGATLVVPEGGAPPPPSPLATAGGDDPWLTFTIRVIKTGRAFSVTAHVDDTFERVSQMLEDSVEVGARRQQLSFDGHKLDGGRAVGTIIHRDLIKAGYEVSLTEKEETVALTLVHRAAHKKWEHRVALHDKVLKLRSHVQQKTMIPLSRITLGYAGNTMWDRHSMEHYKLEDHSVIEITGDG